MARRRAELPEPVAGAPRPEEEPSFLRIVVRSTRLDAPGYMSPETVLRRRRNGELLARQARWLADRGRTDDPRYGQWEMWNRDGEFPLP